MMFCNPLAILRELQMEVADILDPYAVWYAFIIWLHHLFSSFFCSLQLLFFFPIFSSSLNIGKNYKLYPNFSKSDFSSLLLASSCCRRSRISVCSWRILVSKYICSSRFWAQRCQTLLRPKSEMISGQFWLLVLLSLFLHPLRTYLHQHLPTHYEGRHPKRRMFHWSIGLRRSLWKSQGQTYKYLS